MDADIARLARQSAATTRFRSTASRISSAGSEPRTGRGNSVDPCSGPRTVGPRRRETGAGDSGALFEAIEREQAERGNL